MMDRTRGFSGDSRTSTRCSAMCADSHAAAEALFPQALCSASPLRISAADRLAARVEGTDLFYAPDGRAYVTLETAGHFETWPVRSRRFRGWLGRAYYSETGKAAPGQAMTEALALAEARALGGRELTVHVRVAEFGNQIYIDLADEGWRSVEVDPEGWRILERAPVRFRRAAGMLALPEPIQGGSLDELRPFMNIEDER